jgi:pimeloyl-ACP methyl ester carboxylesterase
VSVWPTASRRAAALTGLLLLAACGPGHPAASAPSPAAPRTAVPAPSASAALDGCFTAARGVIKTVPDAGSGTLTLATVGHGPRVVVLSNESDENLCSWLPLSARLAASGYRVVLWDYGGNLPPDELVGLVERLRSAGTARIVLMGASEGAKASLIAGAHLRHRVRGVVSLSAESVLQPAIMVVNSVRRLHCPLLLVTATQDPYGSAPAAREFLAASPSQAKRLVTVPGTEHGTALLAGPSAARTLPAILTFLQQAMGGQ